MWNDTRITKLLGVSYPILQGPFGGNLSTVKLTAAVSNAGGVGGFGCYTLSRLEIVKVIAEIRRATDKPYNINLWVSNSDVPGGGITDAAFERARELFQPFFDAVGLPVPEKPVSLSVPFEEQVQIVLDLKVPVFSFVFGIPSADVLEQCRRARIVTAGGATTVEEALALEAAGVDVIVASGFESGGHRVSWLERAEDSLTGTFVLVQEIRDRVRVPVVAAGGIATGNGIAAALALGADGVQVGTAFLACEESGAPEFHRRMLLSRDGSRQTVLTRAFTGRLGRGLRNRVAREVAGKEGVMGVTGGGPGGVGSAGVEGSGGVLPFGLQGRWLAGLRQAAIEQQKYDLLFLWSGQIAPVLKHSRAEKLMTALVEGADSYFQGLK